MKVGISKLNLFMALFFVVFFNISFWRGVSAAIGGFSFNNLLFLISLFIVLWVLLNFLLTLLSFNTTYKPVVIIVLITSSVASYFMDSLGVMISKEMVQNVFETDMAETLELLNINLLFYVLVLGVLPAMAVSYLEIEYLPWRKRILHLSLICVITGGTLVVNLVPMYKDYSSLARNNRHIRFLVNPTNYIYALIRHTKDSSAMQQNAVKVLGEDAALISSWQERGKKNVLLVVVGETARAQNFSMNGYSRNTNPLLSQEKLINFKKTYSCGTETAISLPCMFSGYDRNRYSNRKGKQTENLLDVMSHAGIEVLWRDNNSGCKGICERVAYQDLSNFEEANYCNESGCYDEVLLYKLQNYIDHLSKDTVIILHQNGSHGPAYYKRYPADFDKFQPACKTKQLQNCSSEEIINGYDNTILYTDFFLSKLIGMLKNYSDQYNTAMLYISDHGESLGENNLYLHGLPYFIAPEEQTHIPFFVWLSDEFENNNAIDSSCLERSSGSTYSHDNLFHSILGAMGVQTGIYTKELDIFSKCRGQSFKQLAMH